MRIVLFTDDPAVIETIAQHLSCETRGWHWNHPSHDSDRDKWRDEAKELLDNLAEFSRG